mmetsp:Transcript_33093/g.78491  ORF Transcript_33093/g.78491 Transcript_33093/m.78491 type:complete len:207 (+) Transcript_33093:803-1423(+)
MYSDMSSRTICFSSSKSSAATALASSVLPTPVGPRNRKAPVGWCGRPSPARVRWIAEATAATASGCPSTRRESRSGRASTRSRSPCESRATGTPVQRDTISYTCSGVTFSVSIAAATPEAPESSAAASISCSRSSSSGMRLYLRSVARARLPSRSASFRRCRLSRSRSWRRRISSLPEAPTARSTLRLSDCADISSSLACSSGMTW